MSTQCDSGLTVRGLAHDLNNLLQIILCAADSISAHGQHAAAADIISRSVSQAMHILDEDSQQRQSVDLRSAVERSCRLADDFARMIGADLTVDIRIEPGFEVYARPASLDRIFLNLLLNAVEASAAAGRESLSIVAEARRGNDRITISFADDGPGFPAAWTSGGMNLQCDGLGLRIIREAVLREGGTLSATNGPSGGALLTLDLEAAGAAHQHAAVANAGS